MKKMPLFLSAAFAALTLASCEKELEQIDSPVVAEASATSTLAKPELLTAGNWHQTGLTVSAATEGSSEQATTDLFAHAKPGMLEQSASYKADGTFIVLRGAGPEAQAAEPITGKWSLNAASDSLILTQADQVRRLAVTELTPTTLRLSHTEGAAGSKASTYTATFSR